MGARVEVGSERVSRAGCGLRRTGARRAEGPRVRGGVAWRGLSVRGRRVGWVHARESAWGGSRCRGFTVRPCLRGAGPVRRSACMAAGCAPLGAGARAVVRRRGPPGVARTSAVWCGFTRVAWPSCGGPRRGVGPWRVRWALRLPSGSACAEGPCACCGILRVVRDLACGADLRRAVGLCVCGASRVPWGLACGAGPLRVVRALCVWCGSSACGAGSPRVLPALCRTAALPVGPGRDGGF